ncbi:MAG: redox-active disulfide protein 2 [Bdellovibrionales bacterium GWB1_55_8]|nr:MAG: redox-active disulfide protein 2 [Bdellovibrionales bacterium GWB1_55_8]
MKKIQILGSGCAKCNQLTELTEVAAKELGILYNLEKVTDYAKIVSFGVMSTPALVVDGRVRLSGKLVSVEELKKLLQ